MREMRELLDEPLDRGEDCIAASRRLIDARRAEVVRLTLGHYGALLVTAFRYGVAAGSAALLVPGTDLCRRDDVERLLRDVTVQRLSDPTSQAAV